MRRTVPPSAEIDEQIDAEAVADRAVGGVVIGAFVRGLLMRDVESLCEQAGAGEAVQVDRLADLRGAARAL